MSDGTQQQGTPVAAELPGSSPAPTVEHGVQQSWKGFSGAGKTDPKAAIAADPRKNPVCTKSFPEVTR